MPIITLLTPDSTRESKDTLRPTIKDSQPSTPKRFDVLNLLARKF
jgi:hypothetical protein